MNNSYDITISVENLLEAWQEFVRGKRKKKDVAEFVLNLSRNIYDLHLDLNEFQILRLLVALYRFDRLEKASNKL